MNKIIHTIVVKAKNVFKFMNNLSEIRNYNKLFYFLFINLSIKISMIIIIILNINNHIKFLNCFFLF